MAPKIIPADMSICEISVEEEKADYGGEKLLTENKSCLMCDFVAR